MAEAAGAFGSPGRAERPTTPDAGYGVPRKGGEMVDWSWVVERLTEAQDYWVATVDSRGAPHAAPIWGVFLGDDLYLETSPRTLKGRNLSADSRVSVHIGGGTAVVIIKGEAHTLRPPPAELGPRLADAFAAKYSGYKPEPHDWDRGGLYRVVPRTVLAWREMNTATRWRLGR